MRDSRHGLLVETPPAQDVPRGRLADELVLMEVSVGEGRRLADVVKEPGEPQHEVVRRRRIERRQRMFEHVLGDSFVLRGLLRDLQLRADDVKQPEV